MLNIKSLISPEREGLEAQTLKGLYWDYICSIGNVNLYIKMFAKKCAFKLRLPQKHEKKKKKSKLSKQKGHPNTIN